MIFPFIKFREQKAPCIAKGPTMQQAVRQEGKFEDSLFAFSLPDSNDSRIRGQINPCILSEDYNYTLYPYETAYPISRWSLRGFLKRDYRFWGPWGVGGVSSMSCGGWLTRPCEPKVGISFFHPRAFELAVIDYIDDILVTRPDGWYNSNPRNIYRAPINWQPLDHLPGPAAYFYVDNVPEPILNHYFVTAVDDADLFCIGFRLDLKKTGPKHIPPEEWVDQRNIKQLMFDIFNSLEIRLSPDVEAKRLKAIEGLKDPSLKKTMPVQNLTYQLPEEGANNDASRKIASSS